MSIHRTSASALREAGQTYVVVPSETIGQLESVEAAGILLYLLDKPTDWQIRQTDIMNRFQGLGRRRLRAAIAELKRLGLLRSTRVAGGGGKFEGHEYDLFAHRALNNQARDIHKLQSGTCGETISHENHKSQNPPGGERDHLHIDRVITHEQINTHARSGDGVVTTAAPRQRKKFSAPGMEPTRSRSIEADLTDTSWAEQG